jgi:hypothetical protein
MYNATDSTSGEIFSNSLCRDLGHDWRMTTAPNYRTCTRNKCRAAQRLHQGRWVDARSHATATSPASSDKQQGIHTQPLSIWAATELNQQGA